MKLLRREPVPHFVVVPVKLDMVTAPMGIWVYLTGDILKAHLGFILEWGSALDTIGILQHLEIIPFLFRDSFQLQTEMQMPKRGMKRNSTRDSSTVKESKDRLVLGGSANKKL
jgi:hypothetical protein